MRNWPPCSTINLNDLIFVSKGLLGFHPKLFALFPVVKTAAQ